MFFININLKIAPCFGCFFFEIEGTLTWLGADFDTAPPFSLAAATCCAIFWKVSSSYFEPKSSGSDAISDG